MADDLVFFEEDTEPVQKKKTRNVIDDIGDYLLG
jgi:hypothetical protein